MSSRLTLRANALSLSFFCTDETFTSATRLLGCTRATAVINPTNSSTARPVVTDAATVMIKTSNVPVGTGASPLDAHHFVEWSRCREVGSHLLIKPLPFGQPPFCLILKTFWCARL